METKQLHNIWKIKGFAKEKFCFLLSCLLIYPIFEKRKYEKLIDHTVDTLSFLRENLIKIVRFRQHSVAMLYIKYHKQLPKVIEEISCQIIEQKIDKYNFNTVELEIEGIYQLIENSPNYNHAMALEYQHILLWSEQEFINVYQAFSSHCTIIKRLSHKFPWKYMIKIFDLEELDVI